MRKRNRKRIYFEKLQRFDYRIWVDCLWNNKERILENIERSKVEEVTASNASEKQVNPQEQQELARQEEVAALLAEDKVTDLKKFPWNFLCSIRKWLKSL